MAHALAGHSDTDRAKALIAGALTARASVAGVGEFTLRDDQRTAVARIEKALATHGGALLANPTGAGKTVVALAVAASKGRACVLAPAALRSQWERSARRASVAVDFVSLEAVSRGSVIPVHPLLIVDEAHRAATEGSARFRQLAAAAMRTPILLLSATPVVNRRAERDALLSLFLGRRASFSEVVVAEVVVREHSAGAAKPGIVRVRPLNTVSDVPGLAERIRSLPPPFPLADGRAATALVRVTLALAWRSSLAALDAALRRRVARGEVLIAELNQGRWPTRHQLRAWLFSEDATQLALPLESRADATPSGAVGQVRLHIEAVRRLRECLAPHLAADARVRANGVLELLARYPNDRVVVFAQHAESISSLWRELRALPGVVAITGERVNAAAGRWTREEVLRALGPNSAAYSPRDPRGIRLLLTTDLLSEGVELSGVGVVVHGDAPWTPARIEQREGRVRRPGNSAARVVVTSFRAPAGVRSFLQLARRLQRKRKARVAALAAAELRSGLERAVRPWVRATTGPDSTAAAVGTVRARINGFVAAVEQGDDRSVVAGERAYGRWSVGSTPELLLRVVESATGKHVDGDTALTHEANRALNAYLRRAAFRQATTSSLTPRISRTVRRRIEDAVLAAPLARRSHEAERGARLLARMRAQTGIGATQTIERVLREQPREHHLDALESLTTDWDSVSEHAPMPPRLAALLILQRDNGREALSSGPARPQTAMPAPAPPSASTESAAIR